MSLEELEKKVNEKVGVPARTTTDEIIINETDKTIDEIRKVYRLVSNTTRRIESQLQYVEDKVNKVLEFNKYKNTDIEELKRQLEIEELESRLKELKGV